MNPYVQPVLYIRRPGDDHEETHRFADDDPFFSEVRVSLSDSRTKYNSVEFSLCRYLTS